jgi:hypothetical protein
MDKRTKTTRHKVKTQWTKEQRQPEKTVTKQWAKEQRPLDKQ